MLCIDNAPAVMKDLLYMVEKPRKEDKRVTRLEMPLLTLVVERRTRRWLCRETVDPSQSLLSPGLAWNSIIRPSTN